MQIALSIAARRALMAAGAMAAVATGIAVRGGERSQAIIVGPERAWQIDCRPDAQDRRVPWLVRNGSRDRIDTLEAWSENGRWVVISRAGQLAAVDVWHSRVQRISTVDLTRSGRRPKLDPSGTRLAYIAFDDDPDLDVVDLETGHSKRYRVGLGVEYFEPLYGPWIALRYHHAGSPAWRAHPDALCDGAPVERGPTQPDAWLNTDTGETLSAHDR